ncbi:MAG: AAA family ATPase [Smithellaceae bacterium]
MDYFNLLDFNKEPFSNSPEPEFFFAAPQYDICLQMLEMSVRLKRGLSVVIGDVGTGKTTLCRKLIQNLSAPTPSESPDIDTYLLLDPAVESTMVFVKTVAAILGIPDMSPENSEWQLKEKIKNFLFEKGVDEKRIIALIIDEGQKIPDECLEILREFLNYETNDAKLLQTIIFAQPELEKSLAARPNLMDRVDYIHRFNKLNFLQMKAMIEYRISVARQGTFKYPLFTFGGLLAIYFATGGYPRKVVSLCHQALLKMLIQGKRKAGWLLVRSCLSKPEVQSRAGRWIAWGAVAAAALVCVLLYVNGPGGHPDSVVSRVLAAIFQKKEASPPPATVSAVPALPHIPATSSLVEPAEQPVHDIALETKTAPLLGTISIKHRLTLWRVLDDIYGDGGGDAQRQFILANPQIKDIGKIVQGAAVHVPMIMGRARPMPPGTILVSLQSGNALEPLYHSFIDKRDQAGSPGLLFLFFWNKREGRKFAVVLKERFTNMQAAQEAVNRLPLELVAGAKILSNWDGDTVYFNRKFAAGNEGR